MPETFYQFSSYRAACVKLAQKGIRIGCSSHVLSPAESPTTTHIRSEQKQHYDRMHALREYAKVFPTIEFTYRLRDLSVWSFVRAVHSVPIFPVWRLSIEHFEAEKHLFHKDEWSFFVNALREKADGLLILSLERSSQFDEHHLEQLLDLTAETRSLNCMLEFEHRSWSKAEEIIRAAKVQLVHHDTPVLPGVIKELSGKTKGLGSGAILRLLGRDPCAWLKKRPDERYAYHYQNPELRSIADRVLALRQQNESVTVALANYPAAVALENGASLVSILSREL
jgi:hypothetical protein